MRYSYDSFTLHFVLLQQTQVPSQVDHTGDDKVMLRTILKNLLFQRANNSSFFGLIIPIVELIPDLRVIYILTKFGTTWLIFVDATVQRK